MLTKQGWFITNKVYHYWYSEPEFYGDLVYKLK